MVRAASLLWILVRAALVCGYCYQKLNDDPPESFRFTSDNITLLMMSDMEPVAFARVNNTHGRCLRSLIEFRDGRLTVSVFCEPGPVRLKNELFWNTSVVTVNLHLVKDGPVIEGVGVYLCDTLRHSSGVLLVNNPDAQLVKEHQTIDQYLTRYDQDCRCDYMVNVYIDYHNRTGAAPANATEQPNEDAGLPKHYKIVVAALMMIVVLLLCIGCSYF